MANSHQCPRKSWMVTSQIFMQSLTVAGREAEARLGIQIFTAWRRGVGGLSLYFLVNG